MRPLYRFFCLLPTLGLTASISCLGVVNSEEARDSESSLLLALVATPTMAELAGDPASSSETLLSSASRRSTIKSRLISWNSSIADSSARESKYADMSGSAFAFFRGTAHLYYSDIAAGVVAIPAMWNSTANVRTWLQGDLHTQNVGYFDNNNGTVKFDLNDFDDAFIGPFYWDLVRMSTSVYLLRDQVKQFTLTQSEATECVDYFLSEYQNALNAVNGNGAEKTNQLTAGTVDGFVRSRLDKLKAEESPAKLLARWTTVQSGLRRFNLSDPELKPLNSSEQSELSAYWSSYLSDLGSYYSSKGASYFVVKDRVRRLGSGLGSQGVNKFYVLIEGSSASINDDTILEVKEERLPSMFQSGMLSQSGYNSLFPGHGDRARTAHKSLLNYVENHVGRLPAVSRSYLVRRISPYKFSFDADHFKSKGDLKNLLKYAARALAYAHARSDDDYNTLYINYNFEKGALNAIALWPQAKTTMRSLAENYAAQVQQDYAFFLSMRAGGEL